MAPSFFSWLGNGTSLRGLPVTLSGGPRASCDGVTSVVADFDDVDEMNAEGPARKGRRAVVGLAAGKSVNCLWQKLGIVGGIPRRAKEAADLVVDSIVIENLDVLV